MKQGTLITRIVISVLFFAVIVYLAVYAVRSLTDHTSTTLAYLDSLDDSVEVTGVLVREETALSSSSTIMDVLPEEGERVAAGETIAILYQSSEALERRQQLQSLEQERAQLQAALNSGSSLGDAAKLEQQIINSILALRSSTAGGDLSALESNALSLRTQVLQREFAYSSSGDSAALLAQTISDLDTQISALRSQVSYDTSSLFAPCSGLFSGLSDGLESVLTPELLEDVSADQLRTLSQQALSAEDTGVGKLITGDHWYFAAVVDPSTADRLLPDDEITVAFSQDYTGEVDMTVERVGEEESGGCVLILSSDEHLKDVTLLRSQTVDLIFARYTGIRVPKQALHLETLTHTDPDTGEETQEQLLCVYALVGQQAERKAVEIVQEGSDYYLVKAASSTDDRRLRAGDEIIVNVSDLYDGKVMLE